MKIFHPTYLPTQGISHVHANGSISEYAAIRHGDLAFQISLPLFLGGVLTVISSLFASICQRTVQKPHEQHDFYFCICVVPRASQMQL